MRKRSSLCVSILCVLLALVSVAAEDEKGPLTNADVVKMVKAGLEESTIVLAIQHSPTDFDTSPEALIELKNEGVSQKVLDAMLAGPGRPLVPATMIIGQWRASTVLDYPTRHEEISEVEFRTDGTLSSVSVEGLAKGFSTAGTYKISNEGTIETKANGYTQTAEVSFEGPNKMVWRFSDGRVSHFMKKYETPPPLETGTAMPSRIDVKEPEYVGIVFYLGAGGELKPLERQTPVTKVKAKLLGFGGAKALEEVPGARSPVRFKVGQTPEFIVRVFSIQVDPQSMVELFALQSKKNKREVVLQKVGGFFSSTTTIDPKAGTLSILATKYGESSIKVIPASPLPPGEYALRSGSLDLFCFGVDPDSEK